MNKHTTGFFRKGGLLAGGMEGGSEVDDDAPASLLVGISMIVVAQAPGSVLPEDMNVISEVCGLGDQREVVVMDDDDDDDDEDE